MTPSRSDQPTNFSPRALTLALGLAFLPACGPVVPGGGGLGGSASTGDPGADQAQYDALQAQLDGHRSVFLGPNVQDLAPVGNQVFWYDTTNFDFALDRYDDTTKSKVAYSFSIGSGDSYNYRASANLIVTADPTADPVEYHAYAAGSANSEVGTMTMPAPPGAQWDAYAVDGSTVYLIDTSTPGATALYRWIPGQSPSMVTTLESAGVQVGEFMDFGVSGDTLVFIESGRIWTMSISANKATWLMNQTQIDGAVDFRSDGVMFNAGNDIMFFDYQKSTLLDVTTAIQKNPFQINATFADAAKAYQTDFSRWKQYVLYIGLSGLFAYDMNADEITPILLSPEGGDLDVEYRYPAALDDGTAFVTGLTSTDGATGADGPTYQIDLNAVLK
jgi:hypothetical protein